jgi:hypothetical protein
LELFVGYPTRLDLVKATGIQLFVHNSSSQPLIDTQGVSLSAGHHTDIVLAKTVYNKQPTPYSNCLEAQDTFDSNSYRLTVELAGKYEQKYCLQLCFQTFFIDMCGCYDVTTLSIPNSRPCNVTQLLECGLKAFAYFYDSPFDANCTNECPQECTLIEYDLSLSYSTFPTPFYADLLTQYDRLYSANKKNFTSYEQVKESVLSINVYFDDLSFVSIDEVPARSLEQFIGEIGGFIGLCIGTSLLSVVELLELLYSIWQYYSIKKIKKASLDLHKI